MMSSSTTSCEKNLEVEPSLDSQESEGECVLLEESNIVDEVCLVCGGIKHDAWECTRDIADLRTHFTLIGANYEIKTSTALHLHNPNYVPPVSPYHLIQECLYSDPWKVLIACLLLNRTSGTQARPALLFLLQKFPTPYDMLNAKDDDIFDIVKPLGLWRKRTATMKRFSKEYISFEWTSPSELFGVGKYAEDAYKIFCCGKWTEVTPEDHKLNDYHNFLKGINPHHTEKTENTLSSNKENIINESNKESDVHHTNTTQSETSTKKPSVKKTKEEKEKRTRDTQPQSANSKTKKIKRQNTSPFFTLVNKPKEVIVIEDDDDSSDKNKNNINNVIVIDDDDNESETKPSVFSKGSSQEDCSLGSIILGLRLTPAILT